MLSITGLSSKGRLMKYNVIALTTVLRKQRRSLAILSLALASVLSASAQSGVTGALPGNIQYAPVVYTYAGGATTSTLCSTATDTIGDGCVATSSILLNPLVGDADAAGNIYIPDQSHNVIRRIDAATGIITLVAGQINSVTGTPVCSGALDTIGDGCIATQAIMSAPHCVRIDRAGNLIIVDVNNQVVRRIDKTTGIITVLMGEVGQLSTTPPVNTAPSTPITTELDNPYTVVFDPDGNMIVANVAGNFIPIALAINGVIDPVNSQVYNLAGTGAAGETGNGGPATAAELNGVRGVAMDAAGNVFVADEAGSVIRRVSSPRVNGHVTAAGIIAATITNYAGTGTAGTTGDGGPATVAEISTPQDVDFDNAGNLIIEQSTISSLRFVNPTTNIITTYAGTGTASYTGDGGPAQTATFKVPLGVIANLGGRFTVSDDSNSRVRNIYPTPFFSPIAVGGASSLQNVAITATGSVTPSAAALSNTEFTIGAASGCTLGDAMSPATYCTFPLTFKPSGPGLRTGQLKITDSNSNTYTDTLLGIGLAPAAAFYGAPITTIAGNGTAGSSGNSGAATSALVSAPRGGAFDSFGNFYFADSANNVVREITKKTGTISIVAGTGTSGSSGDSASALSAELNAPTGVAIDPAGNLYIADAGNNRIREVSANTGTITTIAGTGTAGYTGDAGTATAATLNNPTGIAIDNAGILYIADTGNNALRAFVPNGGIIVTLAGNGTAGYSGDGGSPQSAAMNAPTAVTVDNAGNIYVADTGNAVIRSIVPIVSGIMNFQANISTYAGIAGGSANSGDGEPATAAYFLTPSGLAVDAAGNLYIAAGNQVRMVSAATGTITTVAGDGTSGSYSGEGGSALDAVLPSSADNLTVDQVGNIYLSETGGNRIVEIAGSTAATIAFGSQTFNTTSLPQSVTLYNSGNQPLNLTNIVVPVAFSLSTSSSDACTNTTVLASGASCTLMVTFTPPSVANYSSQITITDNALNSASSIQTIQVTGIGVDHLNATTTTLTYSPANPAYGQSVTLTATVAGGSSPTGSVNFVINNLQTVSIPFNPTTGVATYVLTGLPAGTDNITANYLGDSANADSSGSTRITVQPGTLTFTANNITIYPTQSIPTLTYVASGFVNGDSASRGYSGIPALATTATSASPVGTYPITIAQGTLTAANYNLVFVPGTLTVQPPIFTITVAPSTINITPGQIGVVTVTVTPSIAYTGTIGLSCGSLPANVVCTFITTSIVINGSPVSTQLNISTNNYPEVTSLHSDQPWNNTSKRATIFSLAFGLPFLSLSLFGKKRARRRGISVFLAFLMLMAVQSLSGCSEPLHLAAPFSGNITIIGTDTNKVTAQATLGVTIP
jgi:hypothetical protein